MKSLVSIVISILLLSMQCLCEEVEESERLMDNQTIQKFVKQLVGLFNQGSSTYAEGAKFQDTDGYQRPFTDYFGTDLDSSNRPGYQFNRPYRPGFNRPGYDGSNQQGLGLGGGQLGGGQLGSLLGLLGGQGGGLGQGQFGPESNFGQSGFGGGNYGQSGLGGLGAILGGQGGLGAGQFGLGGQNGLGQPVPYPYPPRPPTQRPYPFGSYEQQSLFGALSSIAQYDDLRCVPRLLCEITAGSRPGSGYYPSYSQNQASLVPFLSKDAFLTLLTVLNFVDESPILIFGRAALLGYTARGDPRQCIAAYPLCPKDPEQLVEYLNNHNGGFFRFFNQQLTQFPQYAPYYQNNYQNNYQSNLYNNKQPYRKFKKFTKLYDTENSKKLASQYADKIQNYHTEPRPRILYGKEPENKITFDTLPQDNYHHQAQQQQHQHQQQSYPDNGGHRGGKKLKFEDESNQSHHSNNILSSSDSNTHHSFFPSESQNSNVFSFPLEENAQSYPYSPLYNHRKPKFMSFPDKTGTGNLVLNVDQYGNYYVRKDREEPLLESANKIRFGGTDEATNPNRFTKRDSKKLYFPKDN